MFHALFKRLLLHRSLLLAFGSLLHAQALAFTAVSAASLYPAIFIPNGNLCAV